MSKTLAELRAAKPQPIEQRATKVCLRRDLVAEVGALTDELTALAMAGSDDAEGGPPPRLGEGDSPRVGEIKTRLRELVEEMREFEGEVRVAAKVTDGDWRRWVNEHPAREKDQPGHKRDLEVTGGYCNADDLIDDLGTYAHAWNGEEMGDGDWETIGVNISGADKKDLARLVVSMYEQGVSIPKLPSDWSGRSRNGTVAASPAPSGSPTSDSTAGSPKNDTSTTTPTGT